MKPLGPLTADDLIQRREESRELGIAVDLDELTRDASPEVRQEFLDRLARIEAAEREFEAPWLWEDLTDEDRISRPLGVDGRYVDPEVRDEGGMGYLCSAHDVELKRQVALKVMKPWRAGDASARDRFFNEAEITAKLNHPGIVPVYGRVIDDSGLPAYATAFVFGSSLAWAIDRYRRIDPRDHEARAKALASLLQTFVAACEIVAYAHSEMVVHGDVKPLNIMIDDYGATRLVDWGLARNLREDPEGEGEGEDPPPHRAGTRYFISSPEGRPTYSSDVFALGRTLSLILAEPSLEPDEALRPASDTPQALWAIAETAIRTDRSLRYASASALADDVKAYLADRAVAVYRDPWPTRLRRWGSRNRPTVAAVSAVLLVMVTAGPAIAFREYGLRRVADAERERAINLTREMLHQVDHIGKFQATLPGSREMLDRAVVLVEHQARDFEANGDGLMPAAESFYRAGRINHLLGRLDGAAACFDKAVDLCDRQIRVIPNAGHAAELNLKAQALRDWGVVQALKGDPARAEIAWRKAIDILAPVARASAEHQLTQGRILSGLGNSRMLNGDQPGAQALFAEARDILEPLARGGDGDPMFVKVVSDVLSNLGLSLLKQAAPDGLRASDAALLEDSKRSFAEGLRLRRALVAVEPGRPEHLADVASSLNLLANAFQIEGPSGREVAADHYRKAAEILKSLVLSYPSVLAQRRELAQVNSNLNVLLTAQGRLDEALDSSNLAVEMFTRLVEEQPGLPDPFSDLGVALMHRARTLSRLEKPDAAAAASYDASLAFASAAGLHGGAARREGLAKQAVTLLRDLNRLGYFRGDRATVLSREARFNELRRRPDFPKL